MNQSTWAMHLATALASQIIWIANTDRANISTWVGGWSCLLMLLVVQCIRHSDQWDHPDVEQHLEQSSHQG